MTENENGDCLCDGGYYIDAEDKGRCESCGSIVNTPMSRYWHGRDPDLMSDRDWDNYFEIDWS